MKVARYKSVEHGYENVNDGSLEGCASYVRISEFVDVEFPPLDNDEQIQKEVAALDHVRQKTVEEFSRKLAEIDQRKRNLLALTHQA